MPAVKMIHLLLLKLWEALLFHMDTKYCHLNKYISSLHMLTFFIHIYTYIYKHTYIHICTYILCICISLCFSDIIKKDYQKELNSHELIETIGNWVFCQSISSKRSTLIRQMSVSLSGVKSSFLILEKTESLLPGQYLFFMWKLKIKNGKGQRQPSLDSLNACQVFLSEIATGMEKTQGLFIHLNYMDILLNEKKKQIWFVI